MKPRFDYRRLPAWGTLDSGERWWAGYLGRYADDHDLVKEWHYGTSTLFERHDLGERQTKAFLVDSLLTALTHSESRIAHRALLQASGYIGRMGERAVRFLDCYGTAQNRVEDILFRGRATA